MRHSTITAHDVTGTLRFDSKFHLSRGNPLLKQLSTGPWPTVTVAEMFGRENVWTGNIFSRVYATSAEHGKPLLVPYDLFRYVPWSDKILSRSQVSQFDRLEIKRGHLFIVCSGRNLGPVTIADSFCERFAMSHDMIRVAVTPTADLFYLAAFLSTAHGQATIRTDMNGSVIDHTDANQLSALRYPLVDDDLRTKCAEGFRIGFEKREQARLLLEETQGAFLKLFKLDLAEQRFGEQDRARRATVHRSQLVDRIDAEPRMPIYKAWRDQILAVGGRSLGEIADVTKPNGRYRTNYVDDHTYGLRMMNGRQVAQYRPIALRLMNLDGFKDPEKFHLSEGMTLLTADGRAEENLADCAMVMGDRAGWAASGHVHRVSPRTGVNPGLVYLACSSRPVQAQIKALATGSVVDALSEDDVASVIVPYSESKEAKRLGDQALRAWSLFSEARAAEDAAIAALEAEFETAA